MVQSSSLASKIDQPDTQRSHFRDCPDIQCEIDQYSPEEWSQLIGLFDDATCDQTFALRAERWNNDRLSTIVLSRNGQPIACALLVLLTVPILNRGFTYLKMGPLWRPKGQAADPESLQLILEAIEQEYSVRRRLVVISILPPHPQYLDSMADIMRASKYKERSNGMDPDRYLVDVRLNGDEQLKSLSRQWRKNLRKSFKHDFEITIEESEEAIEQFIVMYSAMVSRKKLPGKTPRHELVRLVGELPDHMKPKVVLLSHDGKPIAGAVVTILGSIATGLYSATDDESIRLSAGYALMWRIMNWLGEMEDVHWLDMGGDGDDEGMRHFKKGMIGKAGLIVDTPREFHIWHNHVSWMITESILSGRAVNRNIRDFNMDRVRELFEERKTLSAPQ